jgi:hypothetical protein
MKTLKFEMTAKVITLSFILGAASVLLIAFGA